MTTIWLVERVRSVDHDCGSQHIVNWHASPIAACDEVRRLQAEFNLACTLARPWHEVVDTLFDMYQQETLEKEHGWVACDDDACGYLEKIHQHHTFVTPCEADQALIEQLQEWWHAERSAWQIFVEDEVVSRMSDPPRYVSELVAVDSEVRYQVRSVKQGSADTEGQLSAWARDRSAQRESSSLEQETALPEHCQTPDVCLRSGNCQHWMRTLTGCGAHDGVLALGSDHDKTTEHK